MKDNNKVGLGNYIFGIVFLIIGIMALLGIK